MHRNGICTAEGCDKPRRRRGPKTLYCGTHTNRLRATGRLTLRSVEERYEEKVDRSGGPDACHPWTGARFRSGHAAFNNEGEMRAARWAYKHYVGPLADDEVVRHTCDNPPCQNRRHWLKGTQLDNIADMVARGRQKRMRSEDTPTVKLTREQVAEIRRRSTGERGERTRLGREYGVSKEAIASILTFRTWKSV